LAPFNERGTDVDVVLDVMIHDIDLLLSMVRSPLRSVDAVGRPGPDAVGRHCERAAPFRERVHRERHGEPGVGQARAQVPHLPGRRLFLGRLRAAPGPRLPAGNQRRRPPSLSFEQLVVTEGDALASEIAAFVQAVRARETPPVTGWDGLRALEVAHVVRESVETEFRAAQLPTLE
jgi:predicted dehydrogenase